MRAFLALVALTAACSEPAPDAPIQPDAGDNRVPGALAEMPTWDGARAAGVDFRAVGQEPGWMLDIYQSDQIKLIWDYGEMSATFPLTAPVVSEEGATRYTAQAEGRTLTIAIGRTPCQDSMSGEVFPATVAVTIDERTLQGCGRSV